MHVEFCEPCKRVTPHTSRRACKPCRAKARRAVRRAKVGVPLARYGDLLKIADELWSIWVRAAHDACEMCRVPLHPAVMQCAHGYSREDRIIRFDPDNTFALCSACHRRNSPARQPWYDWMRARLGDRFDRIERASRMGGKLRISDLELVVLDAEARIHSLPPGGRQDWALERWHKIRERMVRLA